jgi:hypothetical protein
VSEPASAIDKTLFLLHALGDWDGDSKSLWVDLPITGGTPSVVEVHRGEGRNQVLLNNSDPRYIVTTLFFVLAKTTPTRVNGILRNLYGIQLSTGAVGSGLRSF